MAKNPKSKGVKKGSAKKKIPNPKGKGVGGNGNLVPIKPGETRNPNGRPKGQKNYATIFREALVALAKKNGKDPDVLEREIVEAGIARAAKGDYRFYKDNLDRLHGTPTQTIKATVETVLPDKDTLDSMDKFLEKKNDPGANS